MEELKPCRMCGSTLNFVARDRMGLWVVCCLRNSCYITEPKKTRKEAIQAWNTRKEVSE